MANPGEISFTVRPSDGLLLSGAVEIDLDPTFLVQMVIFGVLVVVLKPLLYDPVLRIFALREEKTDGAKAEARALQVHAGELLRRYERDFERVNQVAGQERDRLRLETAQLESQVMERAREAAAGILRQGREQIHENVNAVRFQLGQEAERVAQDLADQVLGRGAHR